MFRGNNTATFALLMDRRQDQIVHLRDDNGNSLLHVTVDNQSKLAIKYLIEGGADLFQRNKFGISIMDHARSTGNGEIIALLEQ